MGVGAVIVLQGQPVKQVDIRHLRRILPQAGHQSVIVHGRAAGGRGQEIPLVRDHGEIDVGLRPGQIGVVHIPEALGGPVHGTGVQGEVQLGGIAPGEIHPVHVPLAQQVIGHQGAQGTELLPQGELVGGGVLQLAGILAGQEAEDGKLRPLGQGAALRLGHIPRGPQQAPQAEARQKARQQAHGDDLLGLHVHLLRTGNTGRDWRSR